jgi:hypothetical protein
MRTIGFRMSGRNSELLNGAAEVDSAIAAVQTRVRRTPERATIGGAECGSESHAVQAEAPSP